MYRKITIAFLTAAILGMMVVLPSFAGEAHDYVGNAKCKMCHKGEKKDMIWEKWLETKHAKTFELLDAEKGETKDPKCLKCHVIGFGEATGYNPEEPNEELASVGCEACHGAGNDYKKISVMKDREQAVAAGMVIPTEETCTRCHNEESPTFKGFDYEEALTLGTHMKAAAKAEEIKAEKVKKIEEVKTEIREVKEAEEVKTEIKEVKEAEEVKE